MGREKTGVDEFLEKGFKFKDIQKEYKNFVARSKIEEYGEEDFCVKNLMLGKKPEYIVDTLNLKYPDSKFTIQDVTAFLDRHRELVKYFKNKNNALAKRHLAARTEVEEELANLALFTRQLVSKYDNNNETNATINAIKALNQTVMNYAKIAGFAEPKAKSETKNIINVVSDRHANLADKLLKADFKMIPEKVIDVDIEKEKKDEERDADDKGNS